MKSGSLLVVCLGLVSVEAWRSSPLPCSRKPLASGPTEDAIVDPVNLPRDFIDKSDLQPLLKKSNAHGFSQVAFHALCAAAAASSTLWLAFVSSFFFCGLHETVHRTAFANKFLNDAFADVFGLLTLRPARHYRYYHIQHHRHTGNPELDSELQPGSWLDFPITGLFSYLFYLSGVPFWMDAVSSTIRHAIGNSSEIYLTTATARRTVTAESRCYLFAYSVLGYLSLQFIGLRLALLRYWIVPAFLGQPFLRFYLLAEHRGKPNSPLIHENTRTLKTSWLYSKLAWQMTWHKEHHAWPSVPFWNLSRVHEMSSMPSDPDFCLGYIGFHWRFLLALRSPSLGK